MKKQIILVIVLILCLVVFIINNFSYTQTRVYDCSLSEISPDYPIEVKQECRKLRYEEYLKEQQELRQRRLVNT
jgi:hypothetical protein